MEEVGWIGVEKVVVKLREGLTQISVGGFRRRCQLNKRLNQMNPKDSANETEDAKKFDIFKAADDAGEIISDVVEFTKKVAYVTVMVEYRCAHKVKTRESLRRHPNRNVLFFPDENVKFVRVIPRLVIVVVTDESHATIEKLIYHRFLRFRRDIEAGIDFVTSD